MKRMPMMLPARSPRSTGSTSCAVTARWILIQYPAGTQQTLTTGSYQRYVHTHELRTEWGQREVLTEQKLINLLLVAVHAFMGTFMASGVIPAYASMAEDLNVSLQRTSYMTSLQIAVLGGSPLLWKPLSYRFGRRPIFLLSLLCSCICNIGCAKSPDYASMAACRALVAFFISPAMAIGSAVVTETFFRRERARYLGVWTVMVTLGVPSGPFLLGFVTERVGWRWIFWVLAIVRFLPPQAFSGPDQC